MSSASTQEIVEDQFLCTLLQDKAKAPYVCEDEKEFVDEVLVGQHVDRVVVLKEGLRKIGLVESMPRSFRKAVEGTTDLCSFFDKLETEVPLSSIDASTYYWDGKKEQRVKKDANGKKVKDLSAKYNVLKSNKDKMKEPLYVGELRYVTKRKMREGDKCSTLLTEDMKDKLWEASKYMPMWDRGHAFVGGRHSGSSVHCDQVLWSNIGKNWAGHKILFVWKFGDESLRVLDKFYKKIIKPPFTEPEKKALQSASHVVLVGPGDMFVFSGGNAHMTLGVGDRLSLTAYESYVNLNPENVRTFARSGSKDHFEECVMEDSDFEDLQDDVVDNVEDMILDMNGIKNFRDTGHSEKKFEDRKFVQSLVPSMLQELCKEKFYRRELYRIKRIRPILQEMLRVQDPINRVAKTKTFKKRKREDVQTRNGGSDLPVPSPAADVVSHWNAGLAHVLELVMVE
eukprot:CAMPEP_0184479378 /NCGR_PEP_ID=MMETSP0113_2-20130426/1130_1 /TAXON_ID=91329 /ORGANISM="Norrisiella sphaerica, Strain BC52" /LENGTH=453 /DNA_ID=CAMNT_0026857451 /DNA_START=74 /DNA_END=1431 /DNA_ORIENTATION=+